MKKIIESDLISIAHRILKLKDNSEVSILLKETELLYKKLSLLQFYEENKFRLDATITDEKLLNLVEESSDNLDVKEEISEDIMNVSLSVNDIEDLNNPQTSFQDGENIINEIDLNDSFEEVKDSIEPVTLEIDPVFSIPHHELFAETSTDSVKENQKDYKTPQHFVTNTISENSSEVYHQVPLSKSINDAFANKISIGLNDRIAFEKNLFNGNANDLNRVISQLNTIESYQEAKDFIDDMVKPEFNNWKGKEDYVERFMELVEKRFL